MKQGENLRLAIRGSGDTAEAAAKKLGVTRRMLYNYFSMDDLPSDLIVKVKDKLRIDITQNVPHETPGFTKTVDLSGEIGMLNSVIIQHEANISVLKAIICEILTKQNGTSFAAEVMTLNKLVSDAENNLLIEQRRKAARGGVLQ